MWCEVWFMVSGEHVYCAMCSNMDGHYTWKLHLAYTALSLCGELYRRRQRLCSERECASSHYWLYPVATFEFKLWWLLLKSFGFQGRVESHIIRDVPALVTSSWIGTVCDAMGNFNLQQQRYGNWWRHISGAMHSNMLASERWRDGRDHDEVVWSGDGWGCEGAETEAWLFHWAHVESVMA